MSSLEKETIVAQATAEGVAGLAVVRVSGPGAIELAQKVFSGNISRPTTTSHVAVYGILKTPITIRSTTSEIVDEVLALPLLAPRSYTGEDTVEFFCHGGRSVARQVVAACREAGARPATAGEFTRRAFLNGKLSLDQAEAVADLIHAESECSARAAVQQLLGGLNRQLVEIEAPLLALLSEIEGELEFADDEDVGKDLDEISGVLEDAVHRIDVLLDLAPAGRLLRDGVQVVLTGPTNVGKSSLFNALVDEDRAIVDGQAGTTRDVVTAEVEKNGTRFVFHDTAGLRDAAGRVEQMGIGRTHQAAREADIVLALFEPGGQPAELNLDIHQEKIIPVQTKADLVEGAGELAAGSIVTSSSDGRGLPDLWAALFRAVQSYQLNEAIAMGVVLNERHRHKLSRCRSDLAALLDQTRNAPDSGSGCGAEVVGTMLASILSSFGEISGRVFSEQLLESIFSRFCVGK